MCGIAGIVQLDGTTPDVDAVRRMCDAIVHRGPDGSGVRCVGPAVLGVRRLAIIDLVAGNQPMQAPSGTSWLAFNGELYNYRELREELARDGVRFRTASDTEVVAAALERWGTAALDRFVSMFGLAFWDATRDEFVLARDRLGIKPLYVMRDERRICFASEIKCFVAARLLRPEPDLQALDMFLALGHSFAPRTAFRGVAKLRPSEVLTWSRAAGVTSRVYWMPPRPSGVARSWDDAVAAVRAQLDESVRSHMVSDVPVGALLSGGLDSSAVVALMARYSPHPVRTYTVAFEGDAGSAEDRDAARLVARSIGAQHQELTVGPEDLRRAKDALVYHYDEPFGDPAGLPAYLISQFAHKDVTVLLTGEGGDELFAGYRRYLAEWRLAPYTAVPVAVRSALAAAARQLPISGTMRRTLDAYGTGDATRRFISWFEIMPPRIRRALYSPEFRARVRDETATYYGPFFAELEDGDRLSQIQTVEVRTRLADAYLEKVDKATMAASIEARVPLLDHRLVELALSLPTSFKLRRGSTKAVFRAAVTDLLPAVVLSRAKRGFDPPLRLWFTSALGTEVRDVLLDTRTLARGYFAPGPYRAFVERGLAGDRSLAESLWLLLCLELWHRAYIDSPIAAPAP